MRHKHNKKRRILWGRVIAAAIAVYLLIGITWAAIDSHRRPEHHARCVREMICSVND